MTQSTKEHITRVRELLQDVEANLIRRAMEHDASKLASPEKEAFDQLGERQRGVVYGTPEYFAQFDTVREMGW